MLSNDRPSFDNLLLALGIASTFNVSSWNGNDWSITCYGWFLYYFRGNCLNPKNLQKKLLKFRKLHMVLNLDNLASLSYFITVTLFYFMCREIYDSSLMFAA